MLCAVALLSSSIRSSQKLNLPHAEGGAAVVLVGRNENALRQVCEKINAQGGRAHPVTGDMGDAEDVAKAARAAVARFGGFDVWINDAGIGLHGDLKTLKAEDHERLFRGCYFGLVNGSLEAARSLRGRPGGGVIVNLECGLPEGASKLAAPYSPSKRAVKRFTYALRSTLRREAAPVDVVLVRDAGDPDRTANALLRAAQPHVAPAGVGAAVTGVGLLALASAALWLGRDRLGQAAKAAAKVSVRPAIGRAVRPLVIGAAKRRPLQAARLLAKHPRQALKLAAALR
jgi:NAD(P)-dependent dehydrogenase (short-subunit alcohol dehydrogenase family)